MAAPIDEFVGKCAMVVEDVPSMRQLLVRLLQEIGFSPVIHSEDGADALKRIESATHPIDLIVCDLEMPIISGIEFIQMLRRHADPGVANTPVVVVTAHSEERNLFDAVRLGVHGFLVKPVSRKALETRARHALTRGPISPEVLNRKPGPQRSVQVLSGQQASRREPPAPAPTPSGGKVIKPK